MKTSKPWMLILTIGSLVNAADSFAQPTLEFSSSSGTAASGSTTTNQVITFLNNSNNPAGNNFAAFTPSTTATFAISNQQYTLPAGQNANGADVSFGGTINGSAQTIGSFTTFSAMNGIGSASAGNFSSSSTVGTAGTGISLTSDYAVGIFTSAMGLYNAGSSTSGRYYMADLTITFNRGITDPVLQVVGLGGTFATGGPSALGLTSELELQTSGVTLSKLSGSTELNVTGNKILNAATHPAATTGSGAASGSVLMTGSNITKLVFKIYLRGDGVLSTWSNASQHTGDAFLIGVSALSTAVTLPLSMTDFRAQLQDRTCLLQWQTMREENTGHFEIQSSTDASSWKSLGIVAAAGNNALPRAYDFTDRSPANGRNFYRLVEVDLDGRTTCSPIVQVNLASSTNITLYPNPVRNSFTIGSGRTALPVVQVLSLSGKVVRTMSNMHSGEMVDISHIPAGVYLVLIQEDNGETHTIKIQKLSDSQ